MIALFLSLATGFGGYQRFLPFALQMYPLCPFPSEMLCVRHQLFLGIHAYAHQCTPQQRRCNDKGVYQFGLDCCSFHSNNPARLLLSIELLDILDHLRMTDTTKSAEMSSFNAGCQQLDGFHNLVQELSGYLDTAQSLAFSEICDPNAVIHRMRTYESDRSEWAKYAYEDENQCFTRNMVERGLGKSNIVRSHLGRETRDLTMMLQLILVWTPGKESPVHDHAGSHCVMKVLQGSLKETRYKWPERKVTEEWQRSPLQAQGSTILSRDNVTYISDHVSSVGQLFNKAG